MSLSHVQWMKQALEVATLAAAMDEVPIGAILVHQGKVIGRGHNRRETDRRVIAHAEIVALEAYNRESSAWRLPEGTSVYVTAEPCLMCTGALLEARVTRIYFGCSDTKHAGLRTVWTAIEAGVFDHRPDEILGGILEDEAAALLSSFFQNKRLIP